MVSAGRMAPMTGLDQAGAVGLAAAALAATGCGAADDAQDKADDLRDQAQDATEQIRTRPTR